MTIIDKLSDAHWTDESYVQRLTTKDWKDILLNKDDNLVFKGKVRRLVAKNIGYGVVEISKEKIEVQE